MTVRLAIALAMVVAAAVACSILISTEKVTSSDRVTTEGKSMSDEEKPGAKILRLPLPSAPSAAPAPADGGAETIDPDALRTVHDPWCGHLQKFIHPSTRSVTCAKCHCQLDSFDVLADWVRKREALIYEEKERRRLIAELTKEVDELKRQVRNMKAQLRRGEEKARKRQRKPDAAPLAVREDVWPWPNRE